MSVWKSDETLLTVFHHQMKHLEVRQKYSASRRIFNSLLGVSSGDETLHLMFDILLKHSTRCFIRYADSSQKNLTASRFFNPALLGVWIPEETLLVVFDLLLETRVRVFI